MRGAILLAILAVAMAAQADAARPRPTRPAPPPASTIEPPDSVVSITPSADGTSLMVKGWLDVGSFIKFRRVLAANPGIKTVRLASAGGLIQEGALIASTIRDAGLDTQVETLCASACTLALAAGIERGASPEAWIGFHRARWVPREGEPDPGPSEADPDVLQRGILRRAGIDAAFIASALNAPSDSIWFPARQTLVDANVLTLSAEAPARDDVTAAKAESAAMMRASPLWSSVERHAPIEFARAFGLVWRLKTTGLDDAAIMAEAQSGLVRAMLPQIASAPETLTAAFLASLAIAEPAGCATTGWGARLTSADQQAEQADLIIKIMARNEAFATMGLKEARRGLRKPLAKTAAAFPGLRRSSDAETRCRAGLDLIQRIATLDEDKRRKAFQAYAILQKEGELPAHAIPA